MDIPQWLDAQRLERDKPYCVDDLYVYSTSLRKKSIMLCHEFANYAYNTYAYDDIKMLPNELIIFSLRFPEIDGKTLVLFLTNKLSLFTFYGEEYFVTDGSCWLNPYHIKILPKFIDSKSIAKILFDWTNEHKNEALPHNIVCTIHDGTFFTIITSLVEYVDNAGEPEILSYGDIIKTFLGTNIAV